MDEIRYGNTDYQKDMAASKFVVLLILSAFSAVTDLIIGSIGGVVAHKVSFSNISNVFTLLFVSVVSLVIAESLGSMSIPLPSKFGAEKARTLSFISFIVCAAICFGIYELLTLFGVSFTDYSVFILLCCSPLIALVWNLAMYKISFTIFAKKELLY